MIALSERQFRYLQSQFGAEMAEVDVWHDKVHVFGRMPATNKNGWFFVGTRADIDREIEHEEEHRVNHMSRSALTDELAAAGEYTQDWETAELDDLRDRVLQLKRSVS